MLLLMFQIELVQAVLMERHCMSYLRRKVRLYVFGIKCYVHIPKNKKKWEAKRGLLFKKHYERLSYNCFNLQGHLQKKT